jgi:hypothetical protein
VSLEELKMNLPQTNYSLRNLTIEEEFRLTGSLVPDSILLLLGDIDSLGEEIDALNAHIAKLTEDIAYMVTCANNIKAILKSAEE